MSEKLRQSEICIVINDETPVTVCAKHLSWDGLLHCKAIIQFAGKRTFKISEHLAKLQAQWLIVSYAPRMQIQTNILKQVFEWLSLT